MNEGPPSHRVIARTGALKLTLMLIAWETLPLDAALAQPAATGAPAALPPSITLLAVSVLVLLVLGALAVVLYTRRVRAEVAELATMAQKLASGEDVPERRFRSLALRQLQTTLRDAAQRQAKLVGDLRDSEAVARERLAAIEQAERRKDALLALLAHELRNPLAPIRTAAESLRATPSDAREIARAREVITRQAMQLSRLVDDLLDVSRVSQGKIALQTVLLDLRTVVSVSVHGALALAVPRKQAIMWNEPREPIWVEGDLVRLAQIVDNLLSNALKFSPGNARVNVWLRTEGQSALLTVHDEGVGIPPEMLDRVFDGFVQGDDSIERASGGLGLGLTLVRELVRLHHGTVQVASEGRGHGATFTVRLPLSTRTPDHVAPQRAAVHGASGELSGRVLVVDDNRDAAEALAWILEPQHQVALAYDGRSAVELARSFLPDVVLLDIGLPVLNGYQVAEELRKMPETSHAVIIAITGYGKSSDRERALQSGFDFHLVKPAEPTQVLRMIEDALQHRDESRA
jgi:signal transduction histidine kinase/ActR/RegA family two-component response regulator